MRYTGPVSCEEFKKQVNKILLSIGESLDNTEATILEGVYEGLSYPALKDTRPLGGLFAYAQRGVARQFVDFNHFNTKIKINFIHIYFLVF